MRPLSLVLVLTLSPLTACDRAPTTPVAAAPPQSSAPQSPAPQSSAPQSPAPQSPAPVAATTPATPSAPDAPPSCAALAVHVADLVQRTGTAKARASLQPLDQARAECERRTPDPAMMRCFAAATDAAGLDACNRQAFPGAVDATPVRSFSAVRDNDAVDPPVLTRDGDYLAWDDDCGLLYREVYPAGAMFVACKGRVEIGPLVTSEEIEGVVRTLSDQERSRHAMVMGLVSRAASGDFRVPVHVYAANGAYRGIEYR